MRVCLLPPLAALMLVVSAHGDTALRLGLEESVERAALVVEARVVEVRAVRDPSGIVCTDHVLAVSRTLFGEHRSARTVRMPGGRLPDGSGTVLAGLPRLAPGADVILLLTAPSERGWRVPVGAAQGTWFVSTGPDGVRRVGRDLAGLRGLAPAEPEPGAALPLPREHDAFLRRLEQEVRAKLARIEARRREQEEAR